jgi:Arc/MetJ family transcription regulator
MARQEVVGRIPQLRAQDLQAQWVPGSLAHAVHRLIDALDLSAFAARCRNEDIDEEWGLAALAAHLSESWDLYGMRGDTHMRTNIVIDDKLMAPTLKATGLKTKREAVEEGLRTLLRSKQQTGLRKLRGKHEWVGDLDAMRRDK